MSVDFLRVHHSFIPQDECRLFACIWLFIFRETGGNVITQKVSIFTGLLNWIALSGKDNLQRLRKLFRCVRSRFVQCLNDSEVYLLAFKVKLGKPGFPLGMKRNNFHKGSLQTIEILNRNSTKEFWALIYHKKLIPNVSQPNYVSLIWIFDSDKLIISFKRFQFMIRITQLFSSLKAHVMWKHFCGIRNKKNKYCPVLPKTRRLDWKFLRIFLWRHIEQKIVLENWNEWNPCLMYKRQTF